MEKTKVLLIQEYIPHYRIPIFNGIAKQVDLTVIYSAGDLPQGAEFKSVFIPKKRIPINLLFKRTSRTYSTKSYYKIAKKFDVVICIAYYNWVDMSMMEFFPHKYKFIYWGIGVAASYGVLYDNSISFAKETCRHSRNVDAMIFYSDYPKRKYVKMGVNPNKLFVANNTVQVNCDSYSACDRDSILFIGTLYRDKRVDILIESYDRAFRKNCDLPQLIIIGDGDERSKLELLAQEKRLGDKIVFTGKITDDNILKDYFAHAIMCVSPNQAGLSVLKSMGYGVPYVTHKDAVTGGEIFNIHNDEDGIIMNDFSELEGIIIESSENPSKFISMGQKAFDFYHNERQPQQMVQSFIDAINYVLNN